MCVSIIEREERRGLVKEERGGDEDDKGPVMGQEKDELM